MADPAPTKEEPKDIKPEDKGNPAPAKNEELEKAQLRIAELNEENKQRRQAEKDLKAKADRFEKAFKIASGKDDESPDPVAMEKAKTSEKFSTLLLKAAFVNLAAKEMHDAEMAFSAVSGKLKDIKVDVETGEVDTEALAKKVADLKVKSPFLFITTPAGGAPPPKPNQGGHPGTSGTAFAQWKTLNADPARKMEAADFYAKNKPAIQATWPKG